MEMDSMLKKYSLIHTNCLYLQYMIISDEQIFHSDYRWVWFNAQAAVK